MRLISPGQLEAIRALLTLLSLVMARTTTLTPVEAPTTTMVRAAPLTLLPVAPDTLLAPVRVAAAAKTRVPKPWAQRSTIRPMVYLVGTTMEAG